MKRIKTLIDEIIRKKNTEARVLQLEQRLNYETKHLENLIVALAKTETVRNEETLQKFFLNYPKSSGDLYYLQQINLIILKRIKKVCNDNNIVFWLDCGTLLGARRHKGFIPWDDDVDICMMRDDLGHFREALKGDDLIEIEDQFNSKSYIRPTVVFKDKSLIGWVDIIVNDYSSSDITGYNEEWNEIVSVRKQFKNELQAMRPKLNYEYNEDVIIDAQDKEWLENTIKKYMALLPKVAEKRSIHRSITTKIVNWHRLFAVDYMFPCEFLEFEGEMFPVPKEYDDYLRIQFGDIYSFPSDREPKHAGMKYSRGDIETIKVFLGDKWDYPD